VILEKEYQLDKGHILEKGYHLNKGQRILIPVQATSIAL